MWLQNEYVLCCTFPRVSLFCVPKETQKTGESKPRCDPAKDCDWSWLLRAHPPGSKAAAQPAPRRGHARVAVCALTPRPALPSSHRLFLHSQKHTVQIIKHLRGILHFHESISRELISQMLMPCTPGFSPTLQVGSGELILKPTRLEPASDLQEPLPRAEEEPWQFCVCSFCSFS